MTDIGPIRAATFSAPDLNAIEDAYCRCLGYVKIETGTISPALADIWGAPLAASSPYFTLQPADGCDTYLRFVERPETTAFKPLVTHGWNAAEIVVADVDALGDQLKNTPFRIIGAPMDLSMTDAIRAMQVIGPAGEVLYLTEIKRQLPIWDLPQQAEGVGRIFIAVGGGPNLPEMCKFYADEFGLESSDPAESRISVLSNALGIDPETRHTIATVTLSGQSLLELDGMPAECSARPCRAGDLPPGFAMLTILGGSGDASALPDTAGVVYTGANRARVVVGAAGECVEIISTS